MNTKLAALAASTLTALLVGFGTTGSPEDGTLVAKIPASTPRDVTAGFGSIWVANGPSQTVTRINPVTGKVVAVVTVPSAASVLAVGAGPVWVTSYPGRSVTRIDPNTNTARDTISPGGLGPIGITVFDGYVWVANHDGARTGSVAKIDPTRTPMRLIDVIPVGTGSFAGPSWIAHAAGSLWVSVPNLSAVVRIDPTSDSIIATIHDRGVCGELVAAEKAVWVAGGDGGGGCVPGVTRISPSSNTVTDTVRTGGPTDALAFGAGALWYGPSTRNFLGRIASATGTIVGRAVLPGPTFAATFAYGFVWATDRNDNLLLQVRP
jgi:streptogramin lyase